MKTENPYLICHHHETRRTGGLMGVVFNYYIILFSFFGIFSVCVTRKYMTNLTNVFSTFVQFFSKSISIGFLSLVELQLRTKYLEQNGAIQ